ncbi:MAG: phosphohydrolase [Clostridium sp.]|nr:phosphohydrolase [Clostridium sp.]
MKLQLFSTFQIPIKKQNQYEKSQSEPIKTKRLPLWKRDIYGQYPSRTARAKRHHQIDRKIRRVGKDILHSDKFLESQEHIQHGTMSVYRHCINVARYSLAIAYFLKIQFDHRAMIRGALLHDYFQYDWHEPSQSIRRKLHGFYHPGIALKNAKKEYELSACEQDIIEKHMWPMTVIVPKFRESWIVTVADKWCSAMETLRIHK